MEDMKEVREAREPWTWTRRGAGDMIFRTEKPTSHFHFFILLSNMIHTCSLLIISYAELIYSSSCQVVRS